MAGTFQASLAFPGGNISFNITTDNIEVARELCELGGYVALGIGVTTLGVLLGYRLFKPLIEDVVNVVFGYKRDDQDDPNTRSGSLHVQLHCLTDERFLEVLEDYESGGITERLQKEFSQVGIRVEGLKVEIENKEEVEKTRAAIHERSSKVMTEGEVQKLLCRPIEVKKKVKPKAEAAEAAEGEAEKPKKTDLLDTDETKLSTRNDQGFQIDISKEHGNWLTVGELMYSIRKPISIYVDEIVKAFHKKLCKDLLYADKCKSPDNCIKKTTDDGLCKSCKCWFNKLEASHKRKNPSWHQNCNSAKWSEDHWEVAKFFMPALGSNLSSVKDAESTDLSSLLNVLEWMNDGAFLDKTLELVKNLRSMKNVWVHAPKQEFADDEKEKSFSTATKFLEDLEKVCPSTENTKCLVLLKRLKTSRFIVVTTPLVKEGVISQDITDLDEVTPVQCQLLVRRSLARVRTVEEK